ncbi:MAG: hypothetical protein ACOH5I_08970 [Oligoflexus sp.]
MNTAIFSFTTRKNFMITIISSFALSFSACKREEQEVASLTTISIEDVTENPAQYYEKTVTLGGEVEQVFSPQTFRLGGPDFFNNEILVVAAEPLTPVTNRSVDTPIMEGDIVTVTGEVRNLTVAEIEREFSFDIMPEYEVEFENRDVLVARSVVISPRRSNGENVTLTPTTDSSSPILVTTLLFTTADPSTLIGRDVQLEGVQVQSVVGDASFWVGASESERVFVTFEEQPTPDQEQEGQKVLKEGQTVDLMGEIRELSSIAEAWKQRWNVSETTVEDLREQPFYIHATDLQVNPEEE